LKRVGENTFKRIGIISLVIMTLITIFFAFQIPNTTLNYNFEEFFPASDEESDFFYNHRDRFDSENDFILVAIEHHPSVFDSAFLSSVTAFTQKLDELELVQFTRSITNQSELLIYPGGRTSERPFIHPSYAALKEDSIRIYEKPELINSLISEDGSALLVFVRHLDLLSKAKSDLIVEQIQSISSEFDFQRVRLAGRTVGQIFYVETMTVEMANYIGLSMILVVLFLLLAFRSLWGLLIPQIVVVGSMIWIVGFMALVGEPINIILVILPSIMFVVAMSDVVHLVSKYFELLRDGVDQFSAVKTSLKEIGAATFLTSLTTAIGFFSLLFVNVIPIKVFGLYVGIGVLMAFILTFSVLPVLFYFTKPPKIVNNDQHNFWGPIMQRSYRFTLKHRKTLPLIFVVGIIVMIIGALQMKSNNFLMDDLKSNNTMKMDFDYMDEHFGGVRPFEIALALKDTTLSYWDTPILQQLDQLEDYLTNDYGVDIKLSLIQTIRVLNRAHHFGDPEFAQLPDSKQRLKNIRRMIRIADGGKLNSLLIDSTGKYSRINGAIPDWGNNFNTEKNQQLYNFLAENIDTNSLEVTVTGTAHLLDKNMSYLSTSLVSGLLFAILIVALIMGLLFRSIKMVVISMIPNFIPLLVIAAIMGYFDINLKITTAIVFTIAFGIAVDDTIHFLSKFNLELKKGKSIPYALKRTIISTGKAIVLTSAILCSGFTLLLFSDFLGTFYMGLMISITLLFAVIADLFLLPLLILYFYRRRY